MGTVLEGGRGEAIVSASGGADINERACLCRCRRCCEGSGAARGERGSGSNGREGSVSQRSGAAPTAGIDPPGN